MSATALRDSTRDELQKHAEETTAHLLNDRESSAERLHDQIGYVRGLRIAIDVLNEKYAEMHR
jgi:ribosomal protein L29